jgi:hypothetical protein
MKQVFVLALFSVWMFSCGDTQTPKSDTVSTDGKLIDTIVPVISDMVAQEDSAPTVSEAPPADPVYRAEFKVLYTSTYCGGARPTDEILAEHATPKPLYTSTVKLKNHFTGKEYFIKTDADGIGSAEMEEGKYDVFLTKDINSGLATGFDPKCTKWLGQLLLTVKVTAAGKMQDVNIHFVCNPCDENMKPRP